MKTRIIAAGHKMINERIIITSFYDEIECNILKNNEVKV